MGYRGSDQATLEDLEEWIKELRERNQLESDQWDVVVNGMDNSIEVRSKSQFRSYTFYIKRDV